MSDTGQDAHTVYRFSGIEVDRANYSVRRNGRLSPVEPKAFDVLVYLIQHRDRVVSGQELSLEIWGDPAVNRGALTQALFMARKAVGDRGDAQAIIRTIHRRGYRFVGVLENRSGVYLAAPPIDESETG